MILRHALITLGIGLAAGAAGCTFNNETGDAGDDGGTPEASTMPDTGSSSGQDASSGADSGSTTPDATSGSDASSGSDAAADTGTTSDGGTTDATADSGSPVGPMTGPMMGTGPIPPGTLPVNMISGNACTISMPTHWTAAVYVIDGCTLEVDSALSIDQGTILKFGANSAVNVGANGTIKAGGGYQYPIVFTSLKDDANGGDTNGDGSTTTPASADWEGIRLDASGSTFDECRFYYTGQNDWSAVSAWSNNPSVTVTHSIFAHDRTAMDAISAPAALDVSNAAAGTVATNNVFYDNRVPIGVNTTFSIDDSNSFDNSAIAPSMPQPNEFNAYVVSGAEHISANITWAATKVPFVNGTGANVVLNIDSTGSLTLADKVVVKFLPTGGIYAQGIVNAKATSGIVFTSIKDDSHGGDTNGDGTVTTPAAQDWSGIRLAVSGSTFDHCTFIYAGQNDWSAVSAWSNNPSMTVTNSIFAHDQTQTDAISAPAVIDANSAAAGTVIKSNVIYDSRVPLSISGNFSMDDSNSFDNSAASPSQPQPNEFNGVVIYGNDTIAANITLGVTKVAFVVGTGANQSLTIASTANVTLVNNLVMKFFSGAGLFLQQGATLNVGTGDSFTSIHDDSKGGDTNGDGTATMPAATDWNGVKSAGNCTTITTEYYETCM